MPEAEATVSRPHVSVCICTYKRPAMLRNLLETLNRQNTGDSLTFSVVVVDNDAEEAGREVVGESAAASSVRMDYYVQPIRNIALARNTAVSKAVGDFIAFIDDDEIPDGEWLLNLYKAYVTFKADGVLGPVKPLFEVPPPEWIVKGKFCERREYETGTRLHWSQTRTGNVLLSLKIIRDSRPFDPKFAVGGEDVNFFKKKMEEGYGFIWCNEAPVYEAVPPSRLKISYFLKRAFIQGNVSGNYHESSGILLKKVATCVKSTTAFVAYTAILPFTAIFGLRHFMKYLIKDVHHVSRILSLLGVYAIKARNI